MLNLHWRVLTLPWGESMWDDSSANAAEFERLSDIQAENQPWFAQIVQVLLRVHTAGIIPNGT